MDMEDHSQHTHYTPIDLRHFISQRPTHFPSNIPPPPPQADLFRNIHPSSQDHAYHDMMMLMPRGGLREFRASDHNNNNNNSGGPPLVVTGDNSGGSNTVLASAQTNTVVGGLDGDAAFGDAGTGRWPRQETLTLLEIRSRLDSKFKEANQKGPLWDEVSRMMSEEHGYQRSGKKCREKFENLYKYYKKTKEGKAGRQDGKHYRFFRQLEALYGESSNANQSSLPETQYGVGISTLPFHSTSNLTGHVQETTVHSHKLCDSLSLSNNSSDFDSSSYEDNDLSAATLQENNDSIDKRRKRRSGWKAKIKDFIDSQMKKLIERQEAWLDKLTKTLEQKEQERLVREEEWRKQEAARIDKEHKFWARERAWIEARDSALMDALKKISSRESAEGVMGDDVNRNEDENEAATNGKKGCDAWEEIETTRLVQIRSSMDSKFEQSCCIEEVLWEDIATKMGCFGYEKSALMCREKWERMNNRVLMRKQNKEGNKKRKENSRQNCYHVNNLECALYNNEGGSYCEEANAGTNSVSESCFRYFMGEGDSLWENYGLKLNSGDQNQ